MPRFSIVIPVFNAAQYLDDCLRSIQRQDVSDWEAICVDDGSTDNSLSILKRYAARDTRFCVLENKQNQGASYARNRALECASGEYIYFLDSDDMIPEGALAKIYDALTCDCLDGVMFDIEAIFEGDTDREEFHLPYVRKREYPEVYRGQDLYMMRIKAGDLMFATWVCCWERRFLKTHDIWFHEGVMQEEDMAFCLQAMLLAQRMRVLPFFGYCYRRRPHSITTKKTSFEAVRGWQAAYADGMRFLLSEAGNLEEECLRQAVRNMTATLSRQRQLAAACHDQEGRLLETDALLWIADEQAKRYSAYRYVIGYLRPEALALLKRQDEIIIYGASKIGCEVLRLLEEYGIQNYRLAVTKKERDAKGLMGMAVELRTLQSLRETALVVVSAGQKARPQMMAEARRLGFQHVISYEDLVKTTAGMEKES